jgi:hypothetical protein
LDGWGSAPNHYSALRFGYLSCIFGSVSEFSTHRAGFLGLVRDSFRHLRDFFHHLRDFFHHLRDFFRHLREFFDHLREFFRYFFEPSVPTAHRFERENSKKPMKTPQNVLIPVQK